MEDGQSEHTDKQPESHGYLDQLKSLDPHAETMYSGYDMIYGYPAFEYPQLQMATPSMPDANMIYYTGSYPYYGMVYDQGQYAGWQGYTGYTTSNLNGRDATN